MPVAYIIAIVLGVIVLVLLAYLFFSEGGIFSGAVAEQTCIGKFLSYCNFWSICNYQTGKDGCQPGNADFFTGKGNKECETFKSKIAPGNLEDECRKRLNQPTSTQSASACDPSTPSCRSSEWCSNKQCVDCPQGRFNCDRISICESDKPC